MPKKVARILVAYSMPNTGVQTTRDYLDAYAAFLDAETDYLHATHHARINVDLARYDVVISNYCVRYCFEGYVAKPFVEALRNFDGLKILVAQDEYNRTNVLKKAIREIGFDVVLTNVPKCSLEYVYPRAEYPDVRFETVLTGFVPDCLVEQPRKLLPIRERPITIGYRGRNLGAFYGRLGFEKYEIGRRVREACLARQIPHDIEMSEERRLYGSAWFDFVGSCRSMLGSESGSNVFDFDGSLERTFEEMKAARGGVAPSYEEFAPLVADREKEISMGQISPRVFECAVMRTPMVLFRGGYSNVIEPETHYLPLERDFCNADELFERLQDFDALEAMTDRAYEDLIASGSFSYRSHMERIQRIINEMIEKKVLDEGRMITIVESIPRFNNHDGDEILLESPTKSPKSHELWPVLEQKRLFITYRDEIDRLTPEETATISQCLSLCGEIEGKNGGADFKGLIRSFRQLGWGAARSAPQWALDRRRQLLDEVKQFRGFIRDTAARAQQWLVDQEDLAHLAANYREIGTAELERLVEAYEKRLKLLYKDLDMLSLTAKRIRYVLYRNEIARLNAHEASIISRCLALCEKLEVKMKVVRSRDPNNPTLETVMELRSFLTEFNARGEKWTREQEIISDVARNYMNISSLSEMEELVARYQKRLQGLYEDHDHLWSVSARLSALVMAG